MLAYNWFQDAFFTSYLIFFFFLEKKPLNQIKEEIDKLKKSIKNRDQMICAVADKSQDEAK